ncbi:type II toxin-antitoxin system RelE family toxin [Sporomusa malonica]|uniref:mRNA interferase RelE/StbE n=1 Tax=Sporomusa malonica TaxID=112901 RepID=A0A1W2AUE6_9FIRM|nr:mRNA interferase RelE/StbE [Sporomusa malonica]
MPNSSDCSAYNISWSKQALNYLQRLDKPTIKRIIDHVEWLAEDPKAPTLDIKPLTGIPGHFRLRVGKFRVIYTIDNEIRLVSVSHVLPRGEVYKNI